MERWHPADSKFEYATLPLCSKPEFLALSPAEFEYHMRLQEGHRLGMFIKHTN